MKILICADLHNGVPGKSEDVIWSMDIIINYAIEHSITDILVLGDLFHDRVNLNIEILKEVFDKLTKAKENGQTWHIFPGNHDMFLRNSWKITSLRSLATLHNIYEKITILKFADRRHIIVPFIQDESKYMDTINKIDKKTADTDILLTHIGVNNATLNECFLLKNWNTVILDHTKFAKIFAGHFHCHQTIGKLTYAGSPIPFRFDEGMVSHGFLVYDPETANHEFINIRDIGLKYSDYLAPDYLTISEEDITDGDVGNLFKNNNVRIILNEEKTAKESAELKEAVRIAGANKVSLMMPKKKLDTFGESISGSFNADALFEQFIEFDKPELDKDKLRKLHEEIKTEAEERYITVEGVDDD